MLPALTHELINDLGEHALPDELGGRLRGALANWLRIAPSEAARRVREAADLAPRRNLTGEALPPMLPHTAAGQRTGKLGSEHVKVIRAFFGRLPHCVDEVERERAEKRLARLGATFRPDELARAAERLDLCLNPDGNFSDADRARRRGITVGPQGPDGMSSVRGWITPEVRAGWDAVSAKSAAPGMCNPADETPTVKGTPCEEAIRADTRSAAQRNHDALGAIIRSTLMSGELGSHHGLPVSIIVSTTLQELESAAGRCMTGGGTWVPMSDLIRMASHARHYLRIYDKHTARELYLGESKRIATPSQRIVLHDKDRGCTAPGCTVPGYLTEVHHVTDWAKTHRTDIDDLTFACGPHNRLITDKGWRTRKHPDGTTEWIPPPHLDNGQPRRNDFHHPERLLGGDDEDDEDGDDAA
jgi:hypothetical protein